MESGKWKLQRAFTLIELLIVVVFLAIMAVIVISALRSSLLRGNDARRKSDMNRIKIAIEEYEKDHNCYPPISLLNCDPGTGLQPYLNKIPCDPTTGQSYSYEVDDTRACADWYRLFGNLQLPASLTGSGYIASNGTAVYCQISENAPDCNLSDMGTYYACKSGVCVPISFDKSVGAWECYNKFSNSSCNNQCGSAASQCRSTK